MTKRRNQRSRKRGGGSGKKKNTVEQATAAFEALEQMMNEDEDAFACTAAEVISRLTTGNDKSTAQAMRDDADDSSEGGFGVMGRGSSNAAKPTLISELEAEDKEGDLSADDQFDESGGDDFDGEGAVPEIKGVAGITLQNVVMIVKCNARFNLWTIAHCCSQYAATYNPRRFAAVRVRHENPRALVLVFSTGKMLVLGANSVENARKVADLTVSMIVHCTREITREMYRNLRALTYRVRNMVAKTFLPYCLDIDRLAESACVRYEPTEFEAAVISMARYDTQFADTKFTVLAFANGVALFMGCRTMRQIARVYDSVSVLLSHCHARHPNGEPMLITASTKGTVSLDHHRRIEVERVRISSLGQGHVLRIDAEAQLTQVMDSARVGIASNKALLEGRTALKIADTTHGNAGGISHAAQALADVCALPSTLQKVGLKRVHSQLVRHTRLSGAPTVAGDHQNALAIESLAQEHKRREVAVVDRSMARAAKMRRARGSQKSTGLLQLPSKGAVARSEQALQRKKDAAHLIETGESRHKVKLILRDEALQLARERHSGGQ